MDWIIPIFVVIPLGLAFILPIIGKNRRVGDVLTNLATLALLCFAIYSIKFAKSTIVYKLGNWQPVKGIPIGIYMVLDGLSIFMLVTVNLVAFMCTLYSINYMEKFTDKTRYYTLFLLMLAGMNGVILTGDFFNLFVFLEIAAIASYALVAFGTEAEELEAAFKYQVMGSIGSAFILLGITLLYSYTGTLNMADVSRVLITKGVSKLVIFVSVLFIVGFGLKSAIMPFHMWLPDAHPSAPAPISAMLSGVLIKTLGIYALVRVFFNVIGTNPVILNTIIVLSIISMVLGILLAMVQRDLKRLLAYSSISHVGLILLGVGLGTPLGMLGGLFHLLNHAVFKSLLFLNSGAIVYSAGTRDLDNMGGLRNNMPVTADTSLVASMAISGIPPFNGFWSKLLIIFACVEAGRPWLAVFAIVASIVTIGVFMKLQKQAFFGESKVDISKIKEVPGFMVFAMIVLAILCVVLGLILLPKLRPIFLNPVVDILKNGLEYSVRVLR